MDILESTSVVLLIILAFLIGGLIGLKMDDLLDLYLWLKSFRKDSELTQDIIDMKVIDYMSNGFSEDEALKKVKPLQDKIDKIKKEHTCKVKESIDEIKRKENLLEPWQPLTSKEIIEFKMNECGASKGLLGLHKQFTRLTKKQEYHNAINNKSTKNQSKPPEKQSEESNHFLNIHIAIHRDKNYCINHDNKILYKNEVIAIIHEMEYGIREEYISMEKHRLKITDKLGLFKTELKMDKYQINELYKRYEEKEKNTKED